MDSFFLTYSEIRTSMTFFVRITRIIRIQKAGGEKGRTCIAVSEYTLIMMICMVM